MNQEEIELLAKSLLDLMESRHSADLAPKWQDASIFVVPKDKNLKDQEIPINKLLHKIVLIRDNLRVLEQQINSSGTLSDAEKVKFQSYITKCYGSLTTFNFLFYNDEDKFKSK